MIMEAGTCPISYKLILASIVWSTTHINESLFFSVCTKHWGKRREGKICPWCHCTCTCVRCGDKINNVVFSFFKLWEQPFQPSRFGGESPVCLFLSLYFPLSQFLLYCPNSFYSWIQATLLSHHLYICNMCHHRKPITFFLRSWLPGKLINNFIVIETIHVASLNSVNKLITSKLITKAFSTLFFFFQKRFRAILCKLHVAQIIQIKCFKTKDLRKSKRTILHTSSCCLERDRCSSWVIF